MSNVALLWIKKVSGGDLPFIDEEVLEMIRVEEKWLRYWIIIYETILKGFLICAVNEFIVF